jgi:hypothetical protein
MWLYRRVFARFSQFSSDLVESLVSLFELSTFGSEFERGKSDFIESISNGPLKITGIAFQVTKHPFLTVFIGLISLDLIVSLQLGASSKLDAPLGFLTG